MPNQPQAHVGSIRRAMGLAQLPVALTPTELRVASLATLSNADIGTVLGMSTHTVKAHLGNVRRKTSLEGRAAIAVYADRLTRTEIAREVAA